MFEVQFRCSSLKKDEEGSTRRGVIGGQETPENAEKCSGLLGGGRAVLPVGRRGPGVGVWPKESQRQCDWW